MKRSRTTRAPAPWRAAGALCAALLSIPTAASAGALPGSDTSDPHPPHTAAPIAAPPAGPAPATTATTADHPPCVLSGRVGGVTVPAGTTCRISGTLTSSRNVIVKGTLVMRPGSALLFTGVDNSKFQGGGMRPLKTDVGLWVMGGGVLDAIGTPVKAWNRSGTHPTWKKGHELKVAPVKPGSHVFADYTEGATVRRFSLRVPPAEVINLTRSVRIASVDGGKAHVFIHSTRPQIIKHVSIERMGPVDRAGREFVGRYPLHFHHMGEAAAGSLVVGVVVRDSDAHAFVAHASHGITFRETLAYRVAGAAYWWDPSVRGASNASNRTVYERAGAGEIRAPRNARGKPTNSWGAFSLHAGIGGRVVDSWAAGITGPKNTAGFAWPPHEEQSWRFTGNVAHNVTKNGIWVWQNANSHNHSIRDFVAYANAVGIDHGAYRNRFTYDDIVLAGNTVAGLELHSLVADAPLAEWSNWRIGGSAVSVSVLSSSASAPRDHPVRFVGCDFTGKIVRNDNRRSEVRIIVPKGGC